MSAIKQLGEAFRSFDFTERETDKSQARLAHLTGICPKCGDAGWWIDDSGFHTCECPAGVGERAKMAAEDADAKAETAREAEHRANYCECGRSFESPCKECAWANYVESRGD